MPLSPELQQFDLKNDVNNKVEHSSFGRLHVCLLALARPLQLVMVLYLRSCVCFSQANHFLHVASS
jgi:hypothetical protein